MTMYIFTELIDSFETEVMKPSAIATKAKVSWLAYNNFFFLASNLLMGFQHRKKSAKKSYDFMDWDKEKENGILILHQFFKLNLKKLWEPPIIEESFIK